MFWIFFPILDQESIVRVPLTRVSAGDKPFISENFTLYRLFRNLFLPQGYPDSVSEDYINYQFWDTIQAFCSTINGNDNILKIQRSILHIKYIWFRLGTLSTHAILKGIGVGSDYVNPLSATVTWVKFSSNSN